MRYAGCYMKTDGSSSSETQLICPGFDCFTDIRGRLQLPGNWLERMGLKPGEGAVVSLAAAPPYEDSSDSVAALMEWELIVALVDPRVIFLMMQRPITAVPENYRLQGIGWYPIDPAYFDWVGDRAHPELSHDEYRQRVADTDSAPHHFYIWVGEVLRWELNPPL